MSIKSDALKELAEARDEARLQIHLLTMDARDAWDELENKIEGLEQKLSQSGERTTEAGLAAARHLGHSVREFFRGQEHAQSELAKPVRSIMSESVHACFPDDSLNLAARVLWDTNCGAVPVVRADRTLVGMITDRDICMASYIQGRRLSDLLVENAMSKVVHSCSEDESIGYALEIMRKRRVRRIPVIHEDGHLVGVVSLADVARWADSQQTGRVVACSALTKTLSAISEPQAEAHGQFCAAE